MSPITFKFYSPGPRGYCRRVTYENVPELGVINELVDGMVEGRRCLSYRDSEGDVVLLKTSRDIVEAVKDAKDSGAKSIKVQISFVRECPRNKRETSATAATHNKGNSGNQCGGGRRANCRAWAAPQWRHYWSRGLFGHPRRISVDLESVSDEVEEIFKHFAPFFGIKLDDDADAPAARADQAKKEAAKPAAGSENQHSAKENNEHPPETAQPADETPKAADSESESLTTTPADETSGTSSPEPAAGAAIEEELVVAENADVSVTPTFVENEREDDDETGEVATRAGDEPKLDFVMDDKLKLLKEMGFDIPQDVARSMIRELNGRMDLIVRALVANQK